MRYAIFSDIHSNLEALENVLAAYEKEDIDKYFCLGDIVGYGANPRECIKVIQDRKINTVAGNHDWASAGRFKIDFFNAYAREAVLWTREQISKEEINYLSNLDLVYCEEDFCLVHGTLKKPEYFDYLFELSDARNTFDHMDVSLCFVGHTHCPVIFIKDRMKTFYSKVNDIHIELGKQYIVNVGSVGQPRDGDSWGCFCVYDSDKKTIQIKRFEYDIKSAQAKILKAKLPTFLAIRLGLGQ